MSTMEGQHVFITGVHVGLGHALARACLDRGASVYALSRQEPEDLATSARRGRWRFGCVDLRRHGEIAGAVRRILDGVPRLDLVLLNAGILGKLQDLGETTLTELRDVMDVNVWANKVIIDALRGVEVAQAVAISSGAAFNGSGGWGAYSISKSALNLLVRTYADERPDTHFIALAPGVILTAMIESVLASPVHVHHPANARIRQAHEEGRLLTPEAAAANILGRLADLRALPSGAYADIRKL